MTTYQDCPNCGSNVHITSIWHSRYGSYCTRCDPPKPSLFERVFVDWLGVRVERVEACPFCVVPHAFVIVRKRAVPIGCAWWAFEWLPLADDTFFVALWRYLGRPGEES